MTKDKTCSFCNKNQGVKVIKNGYLCEACYKLLREYATGEN